MLRAQSHGPAYVPGGLACSRTLTVSKGKPVKMFAAPATPPLNAFTVPSEKAGPIQETEVGRLPNLAGVHTRIGFLK